MDNMTIVTYGGGEILQHIFDGIAQLFNGGNGGIVRPIAILMASIGGVISVSKAFFSYDGSSIFSKYLLPLLIIPCLLMIPTSSVKIEDVVKNKSYKVDNVPLFLAKFSELLSSIGYKVTQAFETVMKVPNDLRYNKTGMIFGAENVLDFERYKITNADFEQNLKKFSKQCITYDLALGQYSFDSLKKTTDLWKFLKENSSNVRMIKYIDPKGGGPNKKEQYLTCKEALTKMENDLNKEKSYFDKSELIKHLPLTFQALTGIQLESKELISQQLMMSFLASGNSGFGYAESRAHSQQKQTYLVLGALASSSLITIRSILEVLIYIAFLFVVPLSLLPGGIKFFTTWIWLMTWIQLWPPFYAVLNYIQHIVAKGQAQWMFQGLSEEEKGLSIFTSIGLQNLHEDIFALSGYLAASIPFITYAILQGGVQSFIHLAGSMMTPAHSAATAAAGEQTSGNYNLNNTTFGQENYGNTTAFQRNLAPSLSLGHFTEHTGTASKIYGQEETIFKQSNSDLRTSLFSDDSISQSLQSSLHHAETAVESSQKGYSESLSSHARNMYDLTEHLAQSENYNNSISEREAHDIQESARSLSNFATNFAEQHGISQKEAFELFMESGAGANVGTSLGFSSFIGNIGISGKYNDGVSEDSLYQNASHMSESEEFQKNFQAIQDFSKNQAYSCLHDEGKRLVNGFSESLDTVRSSQEQLSSSLNNLDQISQTASWAQNNTSLVKQSLNQDFINWASEKYKDIGGYNHAIDIIESNSPICDSLIGEFLSSIQASASPFPSMNNYNDPESKFKGSFIPSINHSKELEMQQKNYISVDLGVEGDLEGHKNRLISDYNDAKYSNGNTNQRMKDAIKFKQDILQMYVEDKHIERKVAASGSIPHMVKGGAKWFKGLIFAEGSEE